MATPELPPPGRLFTWVDVDEYLTRLAVAGHWPNWLAQADAWWDGLELRVGVGITWERVGRWLDEVFGPRSVARSGDDEYVLELDRPRGLRPTGLPISLVRDQQEEEADRRVPRLTERRVTAELARPLRRPASDTFAEDTRIIAFHSFKGGVGRTLHAVAFAHLLAWRGERVLVVDADLEAPGVTSMYRAHGGACDVAYEDFLALLHGSRSDEGGHGRGREAVATVARYLGNQRVVRHASRGEVLVLPSTRRERLGPPRIEPSDLLVPSRSAYFLTESLAELAVEARAGTVVVDLRAGASELSAPVLLDPRVKRIFVTTVSSQSLDGTVQLMQQLGLLAPVVAERGDPMPAALLTQYRNDLHGGQADEAESKLQDALVGMMARSPDSGADADADFDERALTTVAKSLFREEFLALPASWSDVLEIASRCGLPAVVDQLLDVAPEAPAPLVDDDLRELRGRLQVDAERLLNGDALHAGTGAAMFATVPLLRLVGDHRIDPPVSLVLGAEGSGKTFACARMLDAGTWRAFARELDEEVEADAPFVPMLPPTGGGEGGPSGAGAADARHAYEPLLRGLSEGLTDLEEWLGVWLLCLARAAGAQGLDTAEEAEAYLIGREEDTRPALFLVDRLEEVLDPGKGEADRLALRALLVDVPRWVRRLRGSALGLIVFVRPGTVRRALREDHARIVDRYTPYALRWETADGLRLASWVTARSVGLEPSQRPAGRERQAEILRLLWGTTFGRSRAAIRTSRWVITALADGHRQVLPRDLVRFLARAAEHSTGDPGWDDRLLTPEAMRGAARHCAVRKLRDMSRGNAEISAAFRRLRDSGVRAPFAPGEVELSRDDIDLLEDVGALGREPGGRYGIPQIYRYALGVGVRRDRV